MTPESNKQVVLDFYAAAFNNKDFVAASEYLAETYVQHNPLIADGREGLQARLTYLKDAFPQLAVEVKRVVAEDDYVAAHVHAVRMPGHLGTAIMDIFRFEDGKIAEHWDVLQDIPEQALNQNGMV